VRHPATPKPASAPVIPAGAPASAPSAATGNLLFLGIALLVITFLLIGTVGYQRKRLSV
jgi:hypothetical protein